jgi:L-ascorbate metabolism protein UlaG (beta-lactamase superfamily)
MEGIQFTRYIQATFRIKSPTRTVWVDPYRLTERDVASEKADLILVTHPHSDHLDPDALRNCLKEGTVLVTNPVVDSQLPRDIREQCQVVAIKAGESTEQLGIPIKAVAGDNQHHPRDEGVNTGFVFGLMGVNIYHAGDTNRVPEMSDLGHVDFALYPIGGTYTSDEEEAADIIVNTIKPKYAIPMHYGYLTGGDPGKFKALVGDAVIVTVLDQVKRVTYQG